MSDNENGENTSTSAESNIEGLFIMKYCIYNIITLQIPW